MEDTIMLENLEALKDNDIQEVSGGAYNGPCFVYTIQPGDCLSVLAERYHTTVKLLCQINNIPNPDRIFAGNKLLIPQYDIVYVN